MTPQMSLINSKIIIPAIQSTVYWFYSFLLRLLPIVFRILRIPLFTTGTDWYFRTIVLTGYSNINCILVLEKAKGINSFYSILSIARGMERILTITDKMYIVILFAEM